MAETLVATATKGNLTASVLRYAGLVEEFTDWDGGPTVMGHVETTDSAAYELSSGHVRSVVLSIEPDKPSGLSRMRIGDARRVTESSMDADRGVSVNAAVAHKLFTGMRPDSEGSPGRFTYTELLETSRRGDAATTAENIDDITGEDLVMFVNPDGIVVLGMAEQGPTYGVTSEDWESLVADISTTRGTLTDFVWWAVDVGSELLRRDSDLD